MSGCQKNENRIQTKGYFQKITKMLANEISRSTVFSIIQFIILISFYRKCWLTFLLAATWVMSTTNKTPVLDVPVLDQAKQGAGTGLLATNFGKFTASRISDYFMPMLTVHASL